jgi:hypothetical protein
LQESSIGVPEIPAAQPISVTGNPDDIFSCNLLIKVSIQDRVAIPDGCNDVIKVFGSQFIQRFFGTFSLNQSITSLV